jgi:hypothetical protein
MRIRANQVILNSASFMSDTERRTLLVRILANVDHQVGDATQLMFELPPDHSDRESLIGWILELRQSSASAKRLIRNFDEKRCDCKLKSGSDDDAHG